MNRRRPSSAAQLLVAEPARFSFDAAVRVLAFLHRRAKPGAVRFEPQSGLAFPAAEVARAEIGPERSSLTVSLFGLTGPSGVLPRRYSEAAAGRSRARGLRDFLGLISQCMFALFAGAGSKYRPHREADRALLEAHPADGRDSPVDHVLLALTGYATPHLADRLLVGKLPLQHYAGLFAAHPRSADRLASLVSDWLGQPVEVEQFVGAWLPIPPDQRTRLGVGLQVGAFSRLGTDAAIGERAWDQQAGIILRLGPLTLDSFELLLPHRPALRRLVALVRAYLGFEVGFAINPVLARPHVPRLRLPAEGAWEPRLGWNTWLPGSAESGRPQAKPAGDAVFDAEVAERGTTMEHIGA